MHLTKHVLLPILFTSSLVLAESYVYVTDTVPIPMRSSNKIERNPSNLIQMLDSGTKLEILSAENGWTNVKFDETTGWVVSRYLISNPTARIQLEKLRQDYNTDKLSLIKQNERNRVLETQLADLQAQNTRLSMQTGKSKAEKEHIEQVYKDALKLEHINEKLKTKALQLESEIRVLKSNTLDGEESSARNWFIVGALVLFFGFIMGLVFPKRSTQRRF